MISPDVRPDRRGGLVLAGAVLSLFLALAVSIVLPSTDPGLDETSSPRAYSAEALRGMAVYRSQGCWYCHTQMVRPVEADTLYGSSLGPGDYAKDRPAMLGSERIGPDLTHVGSRITSADDMKKLLRDPGQGMPAYGHLSKKAEDALAAYLLSLT